MNARHLMVWAVGASLLAGAGPAGDDTGARQSTRTTRGGLGAVSGGFVYAGPPYYMTIGPGGVPVTIVPGPFWPTPPVVVVDRGPVGGPVPSRPVPVRAAAAAPAGPRPDPARSDQLITIGDRLFRAQNLKRAEERYEQAARLDPGAAAPRVRLSQVAAVRGQFGEAAERLREAIAAEPGWLAHAPDIQKVYGEPREFLKVIARLESHLLVEPGDRDAWLVLGAELYLSGQTRRASDVFVRLTDRRPDPALAAFLAAATPPAALPR